MELRAMTWHESVIEAELAKTKVLINASAVADADDDSPVPAELLSPELLVLDLMYVPARDASCCATRRSAGATETHERRHDARSTRRPRRSTCGPAATSASTSSRSSSTRCAPRLRTVAAAAAARERTASATPRGQTSHDSSIAPSTERPIPGHLPASHAALELVGRTPLVDLLVGSALFRDSFVRGGGAATSTCRDCAKSASDVVGLTVATAWPDLRGIAVALALPIARAARRRQSDPTWPSPSG